jgi:hypothetical protein
LGVSWRDVEEGRLVPSYVPGMEEDEARIAAVMNAMGNGYITKTANMEDGEEDEESGMHHGVGGAGGRVGGVKFEEDGQQQGQGQQGDAYVFRERDFADW